MRVLCWNLFHGRAVSPAGRDLFDDFARTIAGWDWDIALLQEVPPWWPLPLGHRAHASVRMSLTSRNWLLPLRRALAVRRPDLMKSGGGGSNAILVRHQAILEDRAAMLTRRPEKRVVHAVLLIDGTWVANLHASKQEPREQTEADIRRAHGALTRWSALEPRALLGGDFNLAAPETLTPGLHRLAGGGVDYALGRGFERVGAQVLDAGPLSDHRPFVVEVRAAG
jgi:endonuclease/exonuclease/phosphatase (EEP) superfamily protein YafD